MENIGEGNKPMWISTACYKIILVGISVQENLVASPFMLPQAAMMPKTGKNPIT